MHIELLTTTATAPGATGTAAAAVTGDSLTVKNGVLSAGVEVMSVWQTNQAAGFGQISYPSAHDTTRGYRVGAPADTSPFQIPLGQSLDVQPQELLSLLIAGSAVAGDVEQISMLVRYGNLPGVSQRLMSAAETDGKISKLTTIEQSITSSAGPGYSGATLINNASDLLQANRDYAVLGLACRTRVHAITLLGPDTGNVRIGSPGTLRSEIQQGWFMMMSRATGKQCVPVINSGNKASTYLGVHTDENAGTFVVTMFLGLLK